MELGKMSSRKKCSSAMTRLHMPAAGLIDGNERLDRKLPKIIGCVDDPRLDRSGGLKAARWSIRHRSFGRRIL